MTQIALPLEPAQKSGEIAPPVDEPATKNPDSVRLAPAHPLRRALSLRPPPPPPVSRPPILLEAETPPSDSMRRSAIAGWSIIALFFGGFGFWAATAPLNGAVVAQAVVKVEGNRKSVQHLDGGIVKEMRVKEGDRVNAGDVLIVLDDSQARAEFQVFTQQHLVLRATEERLKAELARVDTMAMPADLATRAGEPDVKGVWEGQVSQFESRRVSLEGQRKVIKERIAQLEHQIVGIEAQLKAYRAQIASVRKELDSYRPLVERGLITLARFSQVERQGQAIEGQIAEAAANIAKARQQIAEQNQQIAQAENERMTEVTRDLRDTQAKLLEVIPKLANARAVLSRIEIRSPYAGRVVGLAVFSVGGVISKGEKILDVVPEQESLVVEAQISVEDISDVRPNARAEVHLTAYKQRITPIVNGDVIQISADRLTDQKSGQPYYVALVRVDKDQLAKLPHIQLYPGMPATVMIPTEERTAFDYLVGPLLQSFNHSFRQR
jgi:HlyD family type I secretion membrane fusion protein